YIGWFIPTPPIAAVPISDVVQVCSGVGRRRYEPADVVVAAHVKIHAVTDQRVDHVVDAPRGNRRHILPVSAVPKRNPVQTPRSVAARGERAAGKELAVVKAK